MAHPHTPTAATGHAARRDYMSTTTTTTTPATDTVVVNGNVMASYTRREAGERPKDIADALGITPSSVSANHRRVRDAIAAGRNVVTDDGNGGTSTASTGAPVVDRIAIADTVMDGAGAFVETIDRVVAHNADIHRRADRMRADADALVATVRDVDAVRALATAAGFDWDAFDAAVADASTPTTDDTDNGGS